MMEAEAKERQRAAGVSHSGNLNNQDVRVTAKAPEAEKGEARNRAADH